MAKGGRMKNQYEIDYQQGYDAANEDWIDRIKQAREEIEGESFVAYGEYDDPQSYYEVVEVEDILKILDKLIEGEGCE